MLDHINELTMPHGADASKDSIFLIFGPIDLDIAQNTIEWIINNNYTPDPPETMTIFINSVGGDLTAAWAIIDVMRGSTIPIRIIGLGQISSAGLLIFAAGEKGKRILTENTSIMMHQYSWGSQGKHHELLAQVKEYNLMQDRLVKFFTKVTKLKESEVNKLLMPAHDVYMTGTEAVKWGLADEVKTLK
jgi:ATP-dependent Clp protease protease subunit